MNLALKHLDLVLGLDLHLIITPAGVVLPMLHPHVGLLFDVFDYLPFVGATVMVNGLPRAQAGTGGITLPPHFPIGGVFAKPPGNENEMFMGSSTVLVDEEPFSYGGLPALSCQDMGMPSPGRKRGPGAKSLLLPTSIGLPIPAGAPVIIGGAPTISLTGLATRVALGAVVTGLKKLRRLQKASRKMKAVSDRLHEVASKLMDKVGVGKRGRDRVHKALCTLTGHPVDVVTGKVVTDTVDWELPGSLPLKFERHYSSSLSWRDSVLGCGWSHSLDLAVWEEEGKVVYRTEEGREVEFDVGQYPGQRLPVGGEVYERVERLKLRRLGEGEWEVESTQGLVHELKRVEGERQPGVSRVVRTRNRAGFEITYGYGEEGGLVWVVDSAGRRVKLEYNERGRLWRVWLPLANEPGHGLHATYKCSPEGDLVEVWDAKQQVRRYAYEGHLLTRETDRAGVSFYFEYEGQGAEAWCVRTWGDGGIYERRLAYDKQEGMTRVTDSVGHTQTYYWDARGVVLREVNELGAGRGYEHNEALRVVAETDAQGLTTHREFDGRGNCTRLVGPDGAAVSVKYDEHNEPVEVVDPNGGCWGYTRNKAGQVVARTNPLGETTSYEYEGGLCTAETGPGGERTEYGYDAHHNLTRARLSTTGATEEAEYDLRGRCVAWRDVRGAGERLTYDACDRLTRVEGPRSEVWDMRYDAEDNLVELKGPRLHVRLGYTGYHWLAWREEAGARVGWQRDTEGRVVAVSNEAGEVYGLERDKLGRVVREVGFDGAAWHYRYDDMDRVAEVTTPGGKKRQLTHDAVGRLLRVQYADGTYRAFGYQPDGALSWAENEAGRVTLERDKLGRVVEERRGEARVRSSYSPAGYREQVVSNLGARQRLKRDTQGALLALTYSSEMRPDWTVAMRRDEAGLEVERRLPGGVRVTWSRDEAGRPMQRHVQLEGRTAGVRTWRWQDGGLLAYQFDMAYGRPTEYQHDARRRLVAVRQPEGQLEYRAMDAVGNLYRDPECKGRRYGLGGRLLEAEGVSYTQEADGNTVEEKTPQGTWSYKWNDAGLLAEVHRPDGVQVHFTYDALTRRTVKRIMGRDEQGQPTIEREVHFVWDGHVLLHEVDSAQGLTTWLFEPESFTPLAKEDATGRYAVLTDHLGTPTEMYDEEGSLVWRMHLSALGKGRVDVTHQHCPWRWPGQYLDEETGLHYNRFRYYDPGTGQYISQDPLGLLGTGSTYTYVTDPLLFTDPLGEMPWRWSPEGMGHHLIPRGKANSIGLFHLGSKLDTPTFFPMPYSAGMHEKLHSAARPHIGKIHGPWHGSAEQLFEASRKGLKGLRMRGELRIPSTGQVLASNVTPLQAFDHLMKWHHEQLSKSGRKSCF